jgi:hypothetical protein
MDLLFSIYLWFAMSFSSFQDKNLLFDNISKTLRENNEPTTGAKPFLAAKSSYLYTKNLVPKKGLNPCSTDGF